MTGGTEFVRAAAAVLAAAAMAAVMRTSALHLLGCAVAVTAVGLAWSMTCTSAVSAFLFELAGKPVFLLDSGASEHLTGLPELLSQSKLLQICDLQPLGRRTYEVGTRNGNGVESEGSGDSLRPNEGRVPVSVRRRCRGERHLLPRRGGGGARVRPHPPGALTLTLILGRCPNLAAL